MNLEKLKQSLKAHEGVKPFPYQDHLGNWTVGVGRNLDANGLRPVEIEYLLANDIETAIAELDRAFQGWRLHSDAVQDVLVELSFAMGAPRLAGFKKMWAALQVRNYQEAAKELLDSKWAREVKGRAKTLAEKLKNG